MPKCRLQNLAARPTIVAYEDMGGILMHAPKWLTWVGVIALLWNLMGLAAIGYDSFATPEGLTAAQQAIVATTPLWAKIGSWVAVTTSVLGSIGLLLKRQWAASLLSLSLLGVIAQYVWLVILSGTNAAFGDAVVVMQSAVLIIALALMFLGRHAARKGWLT